MRRCRRRRALRPAAKAATSHHSNKFQQQERLSLPLPVLAFRDFNGRRCNEPLDSLALAGTKERYRSRCNHSAHGFTARRLASWVSLHYQDQLHRWSLILSIAGLTRAETRLQSMAGYVDRRHRVLLIMLSQGWLPKRRSVRSSLSIPHHPLCSQQ